MAAYYNEIDAYAAAWLRNLIAAGHIAPGDVDERSIVDVRADDLRGYRQCHFFAGIGVWSYAMRLAGLPDDWDAWTASCPCQPFSEAGKGDGFADERHLWPACYHLVTQRRPRRLFGEQVASKDGLAWLDLVRADVEAAGYAFAPVDVCAAGFGAPHMRQRLYFVADAEGSDGRSEQQARGARSGRPGPPGSGATGSVVDAERAGLQGHTGDVTDGHQPGRLRAVEAGPTAEAGIAGGMGDSESRGWREQWGQSVARRYGYPDVAERDSAARGHWHSADWVLCRDPRGPKWRAVEAGTFPLAPRTSNRVGRLRAYGNAINAQVARHFIEAYLAVAP